MLYIDYGKGGAADVLKPAEGPTPPPPPGASPLLGLEVAGRICAVAPDVKQWKTGDLVCALTPGGGYAEYCAVPAPHCLPIPKGLSLREAAALPENFYTVWTNVFDRGRLKAGETFLVHGGSSGIGLPAIQLATAFGATVYTPGGNKEKAEFCRKTGADAAINYREQDFAAAIGQLTNKKGVDLI